MIDEATTTKYNNITKKRITNKDECRVNPPLLP